MRTRTIPAQITTVEDKIVGNLNFTQIFLLMIPIFWTMIVYILFLPSLKIVLYKILLIAVVSIACLILALRIKGKVVFNWFVVILRYNSRSKYYLFNKNENYLRAMDLPKFDKKQRKLFAKSRAKQEKKISQTISFGDLARLEGLIANPEYSFSIKSAKKGGLNVAFKQNQK